MLTAGGIAVAAAAFVPLISRMVDVAEQTRTFDVAIQSLGKTGNTTAGQLKGMVDQLQAQGVALKDAEQIVLELAHNPALNGNQAAQISGLAADGSAAFGGSAIDAAKQLADIATQGYQAVVKLDNATGILSDTERAHIRTLYDEGQGYQAGQVAIEAYQQAVEGAAERSKSAWAQAFDDISAGYRKFLDAIGATTPGASTTETTANDGGLGNVARVATDNATVLQLKADLAAATGDARTKIQAALNQAQATANSGNNYLANGPTPDAATQAAKNYVTDLTVALQHEHEVNQLVLADRAEEKARVDAVTEATKNNITGAERDELITARVNAVRDQEITQLRDQAAQTNLTTQMTLRAADAYGTSLAAGMRADDAKTAALERQKNRYADVIAITQQLADARAGAEYEALVKSTDAEDFKTQQMQKLAAAYGSSIAAGKEQENQNAAELATRTAMAAAIASGNTQLQAEIALKRQEIQADLDAQQLASDQTAVGKLVDAQADQVALLQDQISLFGQINKARNRELEVAKATLDVQRQYPALFAATDDASVNLRNTYIQNQLEIENMTGKVQEFQRVSQTATDDIISAITDTFGAKGESILDSFKDYAAKIFKEIAADAVLRPIIAPIVADVTGSVIGGSSGTSSLASLFGLAGAGSSISSALGLGSIGSALGISGIGSSLSGILGTSVISSSVPAAVLQGHALTAAGSTAFGGATIGQLLGGFGAGFGAGTLLNGLLGGNSTNGTIGAGGGAAAGALIGSIVPGVGTLVGGLLGGLFGGAGGGLFGPQPTNASAGGFLDLGSGNISDLRNEPGNTTNVAARDSLLANLQQVASTLQSETGGTLAGSINVDAGSRDGLKVTTVGQTGAKSTTNYTDATSAIDGLMKYFTASLSGVSDTMKTALSTVTDPTKIDAAIAFAKAVDGFDPNVKPLTDYQTSLQTLDQQLASLSAQAAQYGVSISQVAAGIANQKAQLAQAYTDNYNAAIRTANGQDYINQIQAVQAAVTADTPDLTSLNLDPNALLLAQVGQILSGLDTTQLGAVESFFATLSPAIANLAETQIDSFNSAATAAQAATDAQNALTAAQQKAAAVMSAGGSIQSYLSTLTATPTGGLSPQAQLAAAQANFSTDLTLARGNDTDALGRITTSAGALLSAGQAYNASSPAQAALVAMVSSSLASLPATQSYDQQQLIELNSIDAALGVSQTTLDAISNPTSGTVGAVTSLTDVLNGISTDTYDTVSAIVTLGKLESDGFAYVAQSIANTVGEANGHLVDLGTIMSVGLGGVINKIGALPHASGGPASGLTMINDAGPEFVRLPSGSNVMTANASLAMARRLQATSGGAQTTGTDELNRTLQDIGRGAAAQGDATQVLLKTLAAKLDRLEKTVAKAALHSRLAS